MSVSNVSQFASALREQMNLRIEPVDTRPGSTTNGAALLSKTVSSLDLSNAQYGTLLLRDTLHEQAQAFAIVTFNEQQLISLNTHLVNIQNVADELAVTDPADTIAYSALVEELSDREDQLSSFVGAQFHASELNIGAVVNTNLGASSKIEILNLYENDQEGGDIIGQMAAIEVNFMKVFEALHNENSCQHCIALAQQNALLDDSELTSFALNANDQDTGSIVDVDGKTTTDTGDARLEPLRMSTQWDFDSATHLDTDGDPYLTYSYYDGDVAYPNVYNGSSTGPPATVSSVTSHGTYNEVALNSAFDAWDAVADFSFLEVEESDSEVGEIRVGYTDLESGAVAFAYAPGDGLVNGDIWFEQDQVEIADADDFSTNGIDEESSYYSNGTGSRPGFNYYAALHEIGHSLGLSHPFDDGDDQSDGTDDDLPLAQDALRNTVMSYSQLDQNMILKFNDSGSSLPTYRIWASTPMLYDIEMMEHYYGVENDNATGNSTYSFDISPQTIQTITDSGGTDTFDLSNQTRENVINLTAGSLSSVGVYSVDDQVSDWATTLGTSSAAIQSVVDTMDGYASAANSYYSAYSRTALYTGEYNVAIASSTTIENAIGGSANDTITGNSSNNVISGGAGDDLIEGNGGNDNIDGGAGTGDVMVFNDVRANYTITDLGGGSYSIAHNGGSGADGTDTFTNVEFLNFTDQTIAWPADSAATLPASSGAQGASGSGGGYDGNSGWENSSGTLAGVSVATRSSALAAMTTLDASLETISSELAKMGAYRNRLEASLGNLTRQAIYTEQAIGRIIDADFAAEMAKLTKQQILSQAANAVLYGTYMSKRNLTQLLG